MRGETTSVSSDVDAILPRRHDNGDDHWASPDGKVSVGNPFSTISALAMLHELVRTRPPRGETQRDLSPCWHQSGSGHSFG